MLYLIRHCSTAENESGILCSDKDFELSEKGKQQGNKLSEWFSDKVIDLILTSNSLRANQTASYISGATKADVITALELTERNVGKSYANLKLDELKNVRSSKAENYYDPTQDWQGNSEVESDEVVFARTKNILQKYIDANKNIACVTHAGVIKAFLHCVLQLSKTRSNAFKVRNGCVLVFQNENDFEHLQLLGMYQLK